MKGRGGVVKDDERSEERTGTRENAHQHLVIQGVGGGGI
jgi:hypothetical protein